MSELMSQQIKILKSRLKNYLKNKSIVDIVIIGSSLKDKSTPRDIDLIILFREKEHQQIEETIYNLKKSLEEYNLHIEPLIIDKLFESKIFSPIIHEGFSIKYNKPLSEIIGYAADSLFKFSLEKLNNVEKVRFAQTIYGRKNDGLLQKENGTALGKGAFMVPVGKEELFREVLTKFKAEFTIKKIFVKD